MKNSNINTEEYRAVAKFLHVSPYKVRRVADVVRNLSYVEAMAVLDNLPHKSAKMIKKVVHSAAANAKVKKTNLVDASLGIRKLVVDEGPRLRRVWQRGRGRADLLYKRMSHITVVLDEHSNIKRRKK